MINAGQNWRKPKRLLQIAVAVGGIVPVSAGLAGAVLGLDMLAGSNMADISLASHFQYLSGILLGIGLGFWSCIISIERKSARFMLLVGLVVAGGLARLWSLVHLGAPGVPMLLALVMELGVTPALGIWQWRVARASRRAAV